MHCNLLCLYRQDCPKTRLTNAEWHLVHRLTCTEPGKVQQLVVALTKCSQTSGYIRMQGGGSRGSWQCQWKSGNVPWQPRQHTMQPVLPKGFAYTDTFAQIHQPQHTHRTALHLHSLLQPVPCVARDNRSCWVLVSSGACPMSCSISHQAMVSSHRSDTGQVTLLYLSLQGQKPLQLGDATMHLCTGAVLNVAEVFANLSGLSWPLLAYSIRSPPQGHQHLV
jgi:hypothetical protein